MKTKAAVLWGLHQKWEVEEIDLDGPRHDEVMVKMTASGMCHSDEHLVTGDLQMSMPVVGGHEGAGIVVEVGEGVTDVAEGDPVVLSFIPACGRCGPCVRGMSNLCELGMYLLRVRSSTAHTASTPTAATWAKCACSEHFRSTPWCRRRRWSRSTRLFHWTRRPWSAAE